MRKMIVTLLIGLLLIPTLHAQDDCAPNAIAREIDLLYNTFLATRGEIDPAQMMTAAETFHGAMGEILLRCGSTSVSIENDIAGEFTGAGTEHDPYAFGQPGAASNGVTVRPIEFIRDAAETVGIPAPEGEEWVLILVEIGCPMDSRGDCEVTYENFRLLGDSGTLYDSEFVFEYEELLDVQVQAGRLRTGGIPFSIAPDETSFNLLYYPDTIFGGEEQEITYYRTENFVRVEATTQVVVRSGAGVQFPPISSLSQFQEVVAIGRNDNGSWLQIEGGWISAELVTVTVGNIMWLPVVEPE